MNAIINILNLGNKCNKNVTHSMQAESDKNAPTETKHFAQTG